MSNVQSVIGDLGHGTLDVGLRLSRSSCYDLIAATASGSLFAGTRLVDHDVAAAERISVEALDGFLGALVGRHLYEAEALGLPGGAVGYERYVRDFASFREQVS